MIWTSKELFESQTMTEDFSHFQKQPEWFWGPPRLPFNV